MKHLKSEPSKQEYKRIHDLWVIEMQVGLQIAQSSSTRSSYMDSV